MSDDRNPQREQMADESMVRGLRAQADAIWPGESECIARYELPETVELLDVGCGTGEFVRRFGESRPLSRLIGVDIIEPHLEIARVNCSALGERATFRCGDAFNLEFEDDRFDLTVNRHMLQSIPNPEAVVAELLRVTKPGGRLHLLAEDYAMIHFHPVEGDTDRFWQDGPIRYGQAIGTDLRIGRRLFSILTQLGLQQIDVQYVVVDTLRVPRETFIRIWEAWRDGFAAPIAERTDLTRAEVDRYWERMLDCLRDPEGYAVWQIPLISGVKPRQPHRGRMAETPGARS